MDTFICFSLKWKFIFLRRTFLKFVFQTTICMYFFLELLVSKRGMISSEDLHFLFLHACLGEIDIVLLGIIRFNWKTAKFIMFNNFNFSSFEISIKITFTGHGSKDSRGRGRPIFNFSVPLPSASKTQFSRAVIEERSPLHMASDGIGAGNLCFPSANS